jgi:hypothetical protein
VAFFNKKEEVIDLELTPFGEALLSAGHFKPVYYAFFDDDILYDASGSAGVVEVQNDSEPRIQANTPKRKTQYVFSGIETNLTPMVELARDPFIRNLAARLGFEVSDYSFFPPLIDKEYSFTEPIGSMEVGSKYVPSWDIKVLQGELSAAVNYQTSSVSSGIYSNVRRIPQLDFELNYEVAVGTTDQFDISGPIRERIVSRVYDDGTFLYLKKERPALIFAVDELHTELDRDYDIEVFEILPQEINGKQQLKTLYFEKQAQTIVNNILIDNPVSLPPAQLGPNDVEYFFQVNLDHNIPEETICPRITDLRTRGLQVDDIPYNCPDVQEVDRLNIYRTNIGDGDVEECE